MTAASILHSRPGNLDFAWHGFHGVLPAVQYHESRRVCLATDSGCILCEKSVHCDLFVHRFSAKPLLHTERGE